MRPSTVVACALVVLVARLTAAAQAGFVSSDTLAASPRRLAAGKIWLLVSNGTLVQRPILLSLVSFALLSLFTLHLCGPSVYVASTVVGHIGSTLLAYSVVAAAFAVDRGAVSGVLNGPDYGVSAMQAAWIGAIAATSWRRQGQTSHGRVSIVFACVAIATLACLLRSDITLLDLDHLFAFAIGASFAVAWTGRATPPLPQAALAFARRLTAAAPGLRTAPSSGWLPTGAASVVGLIALTNARPAGDPKIRRRGRLVRHVLPQRLPSLWRARAVPLGAALLSVALSLTRRRYHA